MRIRILLSVPLTTLCLALVATPLLCSPATAQERNRPAESTGRLDRAQEMIDSDRPEEALTLLDPLPSGRGPRALALLLRSTAKIMVGRTEEGRVDLDQALELEPKLRQAWLNRAGLDIAEERYDAALEALETASRLDPQAEDNHLNIGAVLLLQGRIGEATTHFERYLELAQDRAEASYLVAKNYAGNGYARLGVENLRRAVELDESYRLNARIDPAFRPISESPELRQLLETDTYRTPADHLRAVRVFDADFEGGDGPVLSATLEALRTLGESFDPRVEVAPTWAVIHGERMRIKVAEEDGKTDGTVLLLSAPPEAFGAEEWSERTEALLRQVQIGVIRRQRPKTEQDTEEPPPGAA